MPEAIKRIFTEMFSARDLAEPLASFDAEVASGEVRDFMNARAFDVVGIRNEGQVFGYVEVGSLGTGTFGQYLRPLDEAAVVTDTAPLLTVLMNLNRVPFLFITVLGRVGGIITRDDMEKPPVRMWLFGV